MTMAFSSSIQIYSKHWTFSITNTIHFANDFLSFYLFHNLWIHFIHLRIVFWIYSEWRTANGERWTPLVLANYYYTYIFFPLFLSTLECAILVFKRIFLAKYCRTLVKMKCNYVRIIIVHKFCKRAHNASKTFLQKHIFYEMNCNDANLENGKHDNTMCYVFLISSRLSSHQKHVLKAIYCTCFAINNNEQNDWKLKSREFCQWINRALPLTESIVFCCICWKCIKFNENTKTIYCISFFFFNLPQSRVGYWNKINDHPIFILFCFVFLFKFFPRSDELSHLIFGNWIICVCILFSF